MKIQRDALLKALKGPSTLAQKRTTLPIINCVRLESDGSILRIAGTNLDAFEETRAACEGALEAVCVPAKLFTDLARRMGPEIELTIEKSKLKLAGGHRAQISTLPAVDFPPLPEVKGQPVNIPAAELAEAIGATAWAVSDDVGRPILHAVFVESTADGFQCVATTGRYLVHYESKSPCSKGDMMIHSGVVTDVRAALENPGATMTKGDNWLQIAHEHGQLFCKLPEGNYPNWRQALPAKSQPLGELTTEAVMESLQVALAMPDDKTTTVKLVFGADGLRLSRKTAVNEMESDIAGKFAPLTFCCDMGYLAKCVSVFDGAFQVLGEDELSPLVMRGGKVEIVLMGMRLS